MLALSLPASSSVTVDRIVLSLLVFAKLGDSSTLACSSSVLAGAMRRGWLSPFMHVRWGLWLRPAFRLRAVTQQAAL